MEHPSVDLEKELTCSICTELLYQPLTLLDCLHTFCGACLKEWFFFQAQAAETNPNPPSPDRPIFTCPACRDAVRSTRHNAKVATLLDMLLTAQPTKRRTDEDMAEMDTKYRPGEEVLPKLRLPKRTREERRLDEEERRLIEHVQEISRMEAVSAALGGDGEGSGGASESRTRARAESRVRSRDHSTSHHGHSNHTSHTSQNHRSSSRSHSHHSRSSRHAAGVADAEELITAADFAAAAEAAAAAAASAGRPMGHQSSLRSLISRSDQESSAGMLDIEREIEEFARQIQEEGLLDGLDLDNIDLSNNDELSQRIAEAYQRRQQQQRGRSRQDGGSRRSHAGSAARTATSTSTSRPPPLAPALAPAPNAPVPAPDGHRRRSERSPSYASHRSRSSVSGGSDQPSGPGLSPATGSQSQSHQPSSHSISTTHLEVVDPPRHHHQRRRTASEGRSTSLPTAMAHGMGLGEAVSSRDDSNSRTGARSQTDLSLRPADPLTSAAGEADQPQSLPFRARASAMGLPEVVPYHDYHHNSAITTTTISTETRRPITADAAVPSSAMPSSSSGAAVAPLTGTAIASSPVTMGGSFDRHFQPLSPPLTSPLPTPERKRTRGRSLPQESESATVASTSAPLSATFSEPTFACDRCGRDNIQYEVHYNCATCNGGQWNICLDCYRRGRGCQHWFGFGYTAWHRWEQAAARHRAEDSAASPLERPHMLIACRYERRRHPQADGTGTSTQQQQQHAVLSSDSQDPLDRLQSGVFCARCQAWANGCYWRCDSCNEGDWGYCNDCVNRGLSCSHPLLPLAHEAAILSSSLSPFSSFYLPPSPASSPPLASLPPPDASTASASSSTATAAAHPHRLSSTSLLLRAPPAARLLLPPEGTKEPPHIGSFWPLTFTTTCDLCRQAIAPLQARFHCYECRSSVVPNTRPGDYDLCQACYAPGRLIGSGSIAVENGSAGWRRCPAGHRMVVVAFQEDSGSSAAEGSSGGVSGVDASRNTAETAPPTAKGSGMQRRVILQDLVGGRRLQRAADGGSSNGLSRNFNGGSSSSSSSSSRSNGDSSGVHRGEHSSDLIVDSSSGLQTWYIWFGEQRRFERLVAGDVRMPTPAPSTLSAGKPSTEPRFPPSGGIGQTAVARWAWYPEAGADDELAFPKNAEIREVEDVNGEWFYGVYMGRQGLFPGGYVRLARSM